MTRWMLIGFAGGLFTLVGCGSSDEMVEEEPHMDEAPMEAAPEAVKEAPMPEMPPVYTLISLEQGDASCYVSLVSVTGEDKSMNGDFNLCEGAPGDASALVGKPVVITTQKANVMADSCEGNPDCTDTEEVELVVKIEAAAG